MDFITNKLLRQAVPLFSAMAAVVIILGLGTILVLGKSVLVPIALAILLSFALAPVAAKLQRIGLPRGLAVVGAVLLALLVIVAIGGVVFSQTAELAARLPNYQQTIHDKIIGLSSNLSGESDLSRASAVVRSVLVDMRGLLGEKIVAAAPMLVKLADNGPFATLGEYLPPLLGATATGAVVLLFTAFMLIQREDLRNRLIKLLGSDDIQQTTAAIDDAGQRVGRLLLAQLGVNAAFGVAVSLGLWLIGLPSPFLWGVIAGVLRFVPYIGAILGMAAPMAIAFAFDPGWTALLWTLAMFAVIDVLVAHVIEPNLYGASSGLSPIAVVICAAIWGFLWGPIGLVLSTPLTICLVVMGRHIPRLEFLDTLLGDGPSLLPYEMFYQRMLAGDPGEARNQAIAFLKGRTLPTYYDEIALEAIRRAHIDIVRGSVLGARLERMTLSMRSLIGLLDKVSVAHVQSARVNAETAAALEQTRADSGASRKIFLPSDLAPDWRGPNAIAVLYGDHPLDEAAGEMLTQVFNKHGLHTRIARTSSLGRLEQRDTEGVRLVCLSFVEPLSTLHLRMASRAARSACPGVKVMLCIWQQTESSLIQNFTIKLRVDAIVTTISDALEATQNFARAPAKISNHDAGANEQELNEQVVA